MKIPKKVAHMAVEYTARRLESFREGEHRAVNLQQAESFSPEELSSFERFHDKALTKTGLNEKPGVQYDELEATVNELHQELKDVDLDDNGISPEERQGLSEAGQAAMKLAETMMAQEPVAAMAAQTLEGLGPEDTITTIRQATLDHVDLGYGVARALMFAYIDNAEGKVKDVYTHQDVEMVGIPESKVMNTEHTWPKSRGVKDTPAVSDLHHLFPTDSMANGKRASFPFGNVEQVLWQDGGSKLGVDKHGNKVFEPPAEHKGNIARALCYVSTVYDLELLAGEPDVLLQWHQEDPVDTREQQRNIDISRFQKNRNPFIDQPQLVEKVIQNLGTRPVPENMRYAG